MFLVMPQADRRVRHPDTKAVLTSEGCRIEHVTTYWHRRELDGDVTISEINADAQAPQSNNGQGG